MLTELCFGRVGDAWVFSGAVLAEPHLFDVLWAVPATSFLLQTLPGPPLFPFCLRDLLHEV